MNSESFVARLRWLHRLTVVGLVSSVPLCSNHLNRFDDTVATMYTVALWLMWGVMLVCVMVPASSSLTVIRVASTAHLVTLTALSLTHTVQVAPVVAVALALACTLLTYTAEMGNEFVQGSAYGAERRFLLKPPAAHVAVQVVMFAVWYASTFAALALVADARWWPGAPVAVVAVVCAVVLPSRFHRYSRRWLVSVPAGLVVHDHVVLAETAMFTHADVRSVTVFDPRDSRTASGDAPADLSGDSVGDRSPRSAGVVVTLADFDTVVLAATRRGDAPRPVHVRSFVVRPARIARTVAALTRGD